ncbi:MAG: 4Fe-4S binding protein [Limnochordales bacterium]|nr:4Fe-4S binding protein [Limnochordales bacterium]
MAHFITDACIGCTACVKVCPVNCISGERKQVHVIDPTRCIDCHACSYACPVECIEDQFGNLLPRIAGRSNWPKPVVDPDHCTGCTFCVDICPFDCLALTGPSFHGIAELVDPRSCVGCKLCESVCAKGAIVVVPPSEADKAFAA